MPLEIERKFLVKNDRWKAHVQRTFSLKQGYLSDAAGATVRFRTKDQQGFLTIKGKTSGLTRTEFEYAIPYDDALAMLELCGSHPVEKQRHEVVFEGMLWEVDVFSAANDGLILAEIELLSEEQLFAVPEWLGEEVSHDARYFNSQLSKQPYSTWP